MTRFLLVLTIVLSALVGPSGSWAQMPSAGGSDEPAASAPTLPADDQLTEEAIRDVLSELSDEQVRALLLNRLEAEVKEREAALSANEETTLGGEISELMGNYGTFQAEVVERVPNIPSAIAKSFNQFTQERGDVSLWRFALGLVLSLGAGALAWFVVNRFVGKRRGTRSGLEDPSLFERVRILGVRFLTQLLGVVAFSVAGHAVNAWANAGSPADFATLTIILDCTAGTLLALVAARFALAPSRPDLRLVAISNEDSRWLTLRIVMMVVIFNYGFGFNNWMVVFGSPIPDSWLGFWFNLAFHLFLIATIWQGRHIITQMLLVDRPAEVVETAVAADETLIGSGTPDDYADGDDGDGDGDEGGGQVRYPRALRKAAPPPSPARQRVAKAWPKIGIGLVIAEYFLVTIVAANITNAGGLANPMSFTLIVMLCLPFLDRALQGIIDGLMPSTGDEPPALRAANAASRGAYRRISRVAALAVLFVVLLAVWGVNPVSLAQAGVGARFANSIVEALLIAAVAYVAWEVVNILVNREIAREQAERGVDPTADGGAGGEGEGGGEGARLGTILPLARVAAQVGIAVLAVLIILGEFGINVTPLLAGAGVIGLAIGFGAQTLVKDIVSGVFFLIDDAFRKGEYIDVGSTKGVVEKISIRSMQLRHHRGILNTVPFGDIRNVSNMSRDWVVMKFQLRVPYDTDSEKVRKLIKKLGVKLLDHPEFGNHFLEPLKCQGVVEMQDSYMIMPVKYMSRPGDQWALRRLVLNEIHKLFEENDIKFASREVAVRILDDPDKPMTPEDRTAAAGSAARRIVDQEEEMAAAGAKR